MSEQSGSPAMSRVVVAVSVVFVLVALLVVFGGGEETSESTTAEPKEASKTSAITSRTGSARGSITSR